MNAHSVIPPIPVVAVIGTKGPFPRLTEALAAWSARHDRVVWMQYGEGTLPVGPRVAGASRIPRAELIAQLDRAEVVVVHAGTGTIRDALALGHVPVVVPRRAAHGEHVNDHQVEIAAALGARIVVCDRPEDPAALDLAIAQARGRRTAAPTLPGEALRQALRERIAATRPSARATIIWNVLARLTRNVEVARRGPRP